MATATNTIAPLRANFEAYVPSGNGHTGLDVTLGLAADRVLTEGAIMMVLQGGTQSCRRQSNMSNHP